MKSLVKRAQRGDDQAFVELIEENKQAMYKVAVGILKNDFDAADAIQESAVYDAQRSPFCFRTAVFRSQRPPIFS